MQHIEQGHLADHRALPIWTLRDHRAHEQASIRPALNRQMMPVRIFFRYQMFGGRDHVIEYILFLVEHAGAVPVFSKLGTAPQVGHSKDAAMLHPQVRSPAEGWREADIEAAVSGEQCGILAVLLQSFLV